MNIVFLGSESEDKRFLILCLARIISVQKKVVIYTHSKYGFLEEHPSSYEYLGIEIHSINEAQSPVMEPDSCCFIDINQYQKFSFEHKTIAIFEPSRTFLEETLSLVEKFLWENPSVEIGLVYLNLLEYCKISQKFLDIYLERHLPGFSKISGTFPIYFEDKNRVLMLETQFSGGLNLRALTPTFKAVLLRLLEELLSLEKKEAKRLMKKAERMR